LEGLDSGFGDEKNQMFQQAVDKAKKWTSKSLQQLIVQPFNAFEIKREAWYTVALDNTKTNFIQLSTSSVDFLGEGAEGEENYSIHSCILHHLFTLHIFRKIARGVCFPINSSNVCGVRRLHKNGE
jgi:hypothetical protein